MSIIGEFADLQGAETQEQASSTFDPSKLIGRYPVYLDLLSDRIIPDDSIDAIVVPAARETEHISAAADLARLTSTKLVVLCSHESKSAGVADLLDNMQLPAPWVAADMSEGYTIPFARLESASAIPDIARREQPSNLSDKRNVGTAMAKQLGWRKILFVDDDVKIEPGALRKGSLMLPNYKVAGFRCGGFPDKAVVNHAEDFVAWRHFSSRYRQGRTAGHISGNSVLVDPQASGIFFPQEIYDEDLLAFYDHYLGRTGALIDDSYYQAKYDPFANPDRARTEEFGEILTDGLYEPMRKGTPANLLDPRHWRSVGDTRKALIEYLLQGVDAPQDRGNFTYMTVLPVAPAGMVAQVTGSLETALAANDAITGEMCVDYYKAWRGDQKRWRLHLAELPDVDEIEVALEGLGLYSFAMRS